MKKLLVGLVVAIAIAIPFHANASLTPTESSQLNSWLGADYDYTSISVINPGDASQSWHNAVDGVGPTISIYDATYEGENYRIGGYTQANWGGSGSYTYDDTAFIFNLSTDVKQDVSRPEVAIVSFHAHFATFGGGHDLFGGGHNLGSGISYLNSNSYGVGDINILGLGNYNSIRVNKLETYTMSPTSPVPVPGAVWLMGTALSGLVARRKLKQA